jgi:hypothetical protein
LFEELGQILVVLFLGFEKSSGCVIMSFMWLEMRFSFGCCCGFFLCVWFFMGFVVGLFFVLGCFLGFVWLLLWLWERFFDVVCGILESGMQLNVYEKQGFL